MCVSAQPTPALRQFWCVHNQSENCHAVHWLWSGFSRHRQWHHHSSHPDSASSQVTLTGHVTQIAHEPTMPRQTTCPKGYLYCMASETVASNGTALACTHAGMFYEHCHMQTFFSADCICGNGVHHCGQLRPVSLLHSII